MGGLGGGGGCFAFALWGRGSPSRSAGGRAQWRPAAGRRPLLSLTSASAEDRTPRCMLRKSAIRRLRNDRAKGTTRDAHGPSHGVSTHQPPTARGCAAIHPHRNPGATRPGLSTPPAAHEPNQVQPPKRTSPLRCSIFARQSSTFSSPQNQPNAGRASGRPTRRARLRVSGRPGSCHEPRTSESPGRRHVARARNGAPNPCAGARGGRIVYAEIRKVRRSAEAVTRTPTEAGVPQVGWGGEGGGNERRGMTGARGGEAIRTGSYSRVGIAKICGTTSIENGRGNAEMRPKNTGRPERTTTESGRKEGKCRKRPKRPKKKANVAERRDAAQMTEKRTPAEVRVFERAMPEEAKEVKGSKGARLSPTSCA